MYDFKVALTIAFLDVTLRFEGLKSRALELNVQM
jgi:hypothetical protein